jgi:toxin ParE1/3/4
MKVVFREAAYADLDRIFIWIARDRPRSARSVVDRILDSAERLGRFPHMGHVGRAPGTFELVVPGLPYVVVYRINTDDDVIDVVSVFHGAQDRDP